MAKRKGLNIYAICESIAKQTGQPLGAVNKAIVAAGLARLLEKTRLDPGTFTLADEVLGIINEKA